MKLFGWLKKFLFISVIAFSIIQNPTQAMEENNKMKADQAKSTELQSDTFIIKALGDVLNEKIKQANLKEPQNLLDALIQLKFLYNNILNVQFHALYKDAKNKDNNFEFTFYKNGLSFSELEIPLTKDNVLYFWFRCAVAKVLDENPIIKNRINFIVEKIKEKVTHENKEKIIALIENYLPELFKESIKKYFVDSYGWPLTIKPTIVYDETTGLVTSCKFLTKGKTLFEAKTTVDEKGNPLMEVTTTNMNLTFKDRAWNFFLFGSSLSTGKKEIPSSDFSKSIKKHYDFVQQSQTDSPLWEVPTFEQTLHKCAEQNSTKQEMQNTKNGKLGFISSWIFH